MGSVRSRVNGEPTTHVYRIVLPYRYAGDPSAWQEADRAPFEAVHRTDIYISVGQARAAATRFMNSYGRHVTFQGGFEVRLYSFGEPQLQRAELVWAVEQPAVWEPVN